MNVLYFGTVCDLQNYEKILQKCKKKSSVATVVFETSLLSGFKNKNIKIDVHSFPMIPTFPDSNLLSFGGNYEDLSCGYKCRWLRTVNLPLFKQISRRLDARKQIKSWAKENRGTGIILSYSIPPFLAKDIIKLGKKYNLKTVAVVPDLPQNMYMNHQDNSLKYKLKQLYLNSSLKHQGAFDGYVYLTEYMKEVVAPTKPYMVMEGIFDSVDFESDEKITEKAEPRAIMYAGRLHEKYGIMNLLDAFELLDSDTQLWIFGDGTAVEKIKKRMAENNRIRFFGRVSREEILSFEKKATLLVNPRDPNEEFTKYSFPSKNIEYMYSGTPLVTTKLKGIPEEYKDYVFMAESNQPSHMADVIREALLMSDDALSAKGEKARCFIRDNKNAVVQSNRVLQFMMNLSGD